MKECPICKGTKYPWWCWDCGIMYPDLKSTHNKDKMARTKMEEKRKAIKDKMREVEMLMEEIDYMITNL